MTKLTGLLCPRGFIRSAGQALTIDDGHRGVDHLANLLFSGRVNTVGFGYYREVFPIAMELFGNFSAFVQTQKNNPFLYGYNYEFLLDTLKFIHSGHRKVSIHNWKPILAEWVEPHSDYKLRARETIPVEFKPLVKLTSSEIVAKWCSHPNGLEDMVMTMWLMFGTSLKEDTSAADADRLKKLVQLYT